MNRILFVDDEVPILEGLKNVLRGERKRWAMTFLDNGKAALELLAAEQFDVIVTDLRMPGMDGLELLRQVRQSHPQLARVILSGSTDLDRAAEASTVAHQMLTKPCEAAALRNIVDRALRVQSLLVNDTLRQIVCSSGTLPSAPRMYQALTTALADPSADAKRIAAIVEQDVGMSSRVLKFANSAYFGSTQRISTIQAAVVRLGTSAVRHLALTFEVFGALGGGRAAASFEQLERHCLLTARIARKLASGREQSDIGFAAGLLHDVGKLVLMSSRAEPFALAIDNARRRNIPLHTAEAGVLGATHAEVGAYLLGLWDLPHTIVEPVALHHALAPGRAGTEIAAVVALANLLAHECVEWADADGEHADLDDVEDIARLREVARAEACDLHVAGAGARPIG
jgi:putative nucleotidyltransferase with HDIG domain